MRRFFSIFFAFYIAAVTCIPCSDGDACVEEPESSVASMLTNDKYPEGDVDFCSPFCVCSCCNSHINQPKYFSFTFEVVTSKTRYVIMKSSDVQRISYAIWQPPRLS